MWRRSKSELFAESAEISLGEECALFLAGDYRGYLEARGRPIPAWAWVNQLAHGSWVDIEHLAEMYAIDGTPEALIAEIAATALAWLHNGMTLETLQRNTLIPLELELAARAGLAPIDAVGLGWALDAALKTRLPLFSVRHPRS